MKRGVDTPDGGSDVGAMLASGGKATAKEWGSMLLCTGGHLTVLRSSHVEASVICTPAGMEYKSLVVRRFEQRDLAQRVKSKKVFSQLSFTLI
jgi:hypothetical protein